MGQRTSSHLRPEISLPWIHRRQKHASPLVNNAEDNISRETEARSSKCSVESENALKNLKNSDFNFLEFGKSLEEERLTNKHLYKSLNCSFDDKEPKGESKRAFFKPSSVLSQSTTPNIHEKHRHRRGRRSHKRRIKFGYGITDLDSFLTKASIEEPANIPVVIVSTCVLYQTQGGVQDEIALPLGTVVNAVFQNQAWLYVQTPHGQEGYVGCSACLPLSTLPQPTQGPCWEHTNDVFPRPLGNITDPEILADIRSECIRTSRNRASFHNHCVRLR